jgi:hypothetical protein
MGWGEGSIDNQPANQQAEQRAVLVVMHDLRWQMQNTTFRARRSRLGPRNAHNNVIALKCDRKQTDRVLLQWGLRQAQPTRCSGTQYRTEALQGAADLRTEQRCYKGLGKQLRCNGTPYREATTAGSSRNEPHLRDPIHVPETPGLNYSCIWEYVLPN